MGLHGYSETRARSSSFAVTILREKSRTNKKLCQARSYRGRWKICPLLRKSCLHLCLLLLKLQLISSRIPLPSEIVDISLNLSGILTLKPAPRGMVLVQVGPPQPTVCIRLAKLQVFLVKQKVRERWRILSWRDKGGKNAVIKIEGLGQSRVCFACMKIAIMIIIIIIIAISTGHIPCFEKGFRLPAVVGKDSPAYIHSFSYPEPAHFG